MGAGNVWARSRGDTTASIFVVQAGRCLHRLWDRIQGFLSIVRKAPSPMVSMDLRLTKRLSKTWGAVLVAS